MRRTKSNFQFECSPLATCHLPIPPEQAMTQPCKKLKFGVAPWPSALWIGPVARSGVERSANDVAGLAAPFRIVGGCFRPTEVFIQLNVVLTGASYQSVGIGAIFYTIVGLPLTTRYCECLKVRSGDNLLHFILLARDQQRSTPLSNTAPEAVLPEPRSGSPLLRVVLFSNHHSKPN